MQTSSTRFLSCFAAAGGVLLALDANATALNIACVGDSITYEADTTPGDTYPEQLQLLLGPGVNVGNFGHSGATLMSTGDLPYINQPEYAASQSFNPNIVVIMLGTNDAKDYNWAAGNPSGQSEFVTDLENLIWAYRRIPSHPIVCVMTSPYVYGTGFGGNMPNTLNNIIAPLQAQVASYIYCPLIDVHAATANHLEWFAGDAYEVHPNDDGCACIAQVVGQECNYLTAKTQTFNTTSLSVAAQTAGVTYRTVPDSNFLDGEGSFFDATGANQYITFDVPSIAAATYNVSIGGKCLNNKGTFQMAISRMDEQGSPTNIGPTIDEYSPGPIYPDVEFGPWTPSSTSDKAVRFMLVGKDASSSGYDLALNYIRFIKQPTGGSLAVSVATGSTSTYNLTALGTSDWVHWNGSYFLHKATGGTQISDATAIRISNQGQLTQTDRNFSWSDGTPVGSGTNDHAYGWNNDVQDSGWSFTVSANTASRTLNVLFGSTSTATVTISAHLSDYSAYDVQSTVTFTSTVLDQATFTYKAASAGQTLTVTVLKVADDDSNSVDLAAAWLQ